MDIMITPQKLSGTITVIPSKSQAHRLLICAAFSDKTTTLICPETNQDIEATAGCLCALGADIIRTNTGYIVNPIQAPPTSATLYCRESGSTLRFMLPVVGALGVDTVFELEGRLPQRPLSPLWEEMERMGCSLSRPTNNTIRCQRKLHSGNYTIDGSVSSQYITGLLFAMSFMTGESTLTITGKTESKPYIQLTQQALNTFGIRSDNYHIPKNHNYVSPGTVTVEGDWSNGAFWIAANSLGSNLNIQGLDPMSLQGDRACARILENVTKEFVVDAADIPDLVPILGVVAGAKFGGTFHNIARLRLKESDRVETVVNMLKKLGSSVSTTENTMCVEPAKFCGCTIDAAGDHRIAMAAAIASTVADGPVTILGAHCVAKSYPSFWEEFKKLGGHYEQHVR